MSETLCILCCASFHQELSAAVAAEGWEDVTTASFPARCGRPAVAWGELLPLLPKDCSRVIVLGSACTAMMGEPPTGVPPVRVISYRQCFHLIAGQSLVDDAISSGGYLMTPGWLADWRGNIAAMGFSHDDGAGFFKESARELVLIDTMVSPEAVPALKELSRWAQLPARRISVGLDHTRASLARQIVEWRLEREREVAGERVRRHASEVADHAAAMDMMARLAGMQREEQVIDGIGELFRMLFAPRDVFYIRFEYEQPLLPSSLPEELSGIASTMKDRHSLLPGGDGFLVRIVHNEQSLGVVAVAGLVFPRYIERYLNMALTVAEVCGLAIDNARTRKRLFEAEKMAALGIVVSGIAHEINTPLGVSLAATSSLQDKCRHVSERFSSRTLTQSDLHRFFEGATEGTALLLQNLERMGQLIDAFRKVAVEHLPAAPVPFRIHDCINDVLHSFGSTFPSEYIDVVIECDPELVITSFPVDWASVFSNLIGNSVRHGFPGNRHGSIRIRVLLDASGLLVDYSDDGVGMPSESLGKIFDPFFTTNLQQGMGLGMHLVYNLVTLRFGGTISCSSQPGEGMRCSITTPLVIGARP